MIATWMLYAALIGVLVGVAAFSLERAASALRFPTRFIWVAALLVSVTWPVLAVLQRFVPTTGAAVRVVPFSIAIEPVLIIARGSASVDLGGRLIIKKHSAQGAVGDPLQPRDS